MVAPLLCFLGAWLRYPSLLAIEAAERKANPSAPIELHWALGRCFASSIMSARRVGNSTAASPTHKYLASDPGIVLTSFTHHGPPPPVTRKSMRHTPRAPARAATAPAASRSS